MRANPALTVSLIIPVYNGGQAFRMCLDAVAALAPQPEEILVVANGDSDECGNLAQERGFRALTLPEAVGPARARNLGARQASGDILLFVDADVMVQSHAIRQIVGFFQRNPDIAAVFGSYDDDPFETNFLSQYKNLMHHYVHQTGSEEASTFWAGCGAIRREVFLELGGFDAGKYPTPCIEDIELGYRLKKAKYRIRVLKDLQGKHLKRWTPSSLLKADILCRALPWTELILQDKQFINDLNVDTSSRVSVVFAGMLVLSLFTSVVRPAAFWLAPCCAAGLLWLNWSVYRFFLHKRGLYFTLAVIPWHWLYFFYSGAAFVEGTLLYHIKLLKKNA